MTDLFAATNYVTTEHSSNQKIPEHLYDLILLAFTLIYCWEDLMLTYRYFLTLCRILKILCKLVSLSSEMILIILMG